MPAREKKTLRGLWSIHGLAHSFAKAGRQCGVFVGCQDSAVQTCLTGSYRNRSWTIVCTSSNRHSDHEGLGVVM